MWIKRLPHAGQLLGNHRIQILIDPVLTDGVIDDCYRVRQQARLNNAEKFLSADAIFISRQREDHFHPATLHKLKRNKPIFFPKDALRISHALKIMGFTDLRPMESGQSISFGDMTVHPAPSNSATPANNLVFQERDETIWYVADDLPHSRELLNLKKQLGRPTLLLIRYQLFSEAAIPSLRIIKDSPNRMFRELLASVRELAPHQVVPIADDLENIAEPWLNFYQRPIPVEKFVSAVSDAHTVGLLLSPGDVADLSQKNFVFQTNKRSSSLQKSKAAKKPKTPALREHSTRGRGSRDPYSEIDEFFFDRVSVNLMNDWSVAFFKRFRDSKVRWQLKVLSTGGKSRSYCLDFGSFLPEFTKTIRNPHIVATVYARDFQRFIRGDLSPRAIFSGGMMRVKAKKGYEKFGEPLAWLAGPFVNGLKIQRTLEGLGYQKTPMDLKSGKWIPAETWINGNGFKQEWVLRDQWKFSDSFASQTLAREKQTSFRKTLSTDEIIERSKITPTCEPGAFIFHASRCGSTLISQMLARRPEIVMLSEMQGVEKILSSGKMSVTQRTALLVATMNAISSARVKNEKSVMFKFSGSTNWLPWMHSLYPRTPWIYLYRDPEQVIRSNMQHPPPWLCAIEDHVERELKVAERYEEQLDTILMHAENAALVVNYTEINSEFPARLTKALKLQTDATSLQAMRESLNWYSKQQGQRWDARMKERPEAKYLRLKAPLSASLLDKYNQLEQVRKRLF